MSVLFAGRGGSGGEPDLRTLTNSALPLLKGNRHYDVLLTGPAGWAHAYDVQAPNAKAAQIIAREHATRIARIDRASRPGRFVVVSCGRSEVK